MAEAQKPLGMDVSHYQGSITWPTVASDGIVFAWCKATEGINYTDPTFTYNISNGKAAGVLMGAYHFARPDLNTAASEASYYWSIAGPYIKGDSKTLMPMLDVEASAFNGNVGASSLSEWCNQWSNSIAGFATAAGIKIKPVVYVSACNANHFDSSVAGWIPWIANYNGQDPQTGTPWSVCSSYNVWGTWKVWQYTSTGTIPGVSSANLDHDVFNGTTNSLISTLVIPPADDATFVSCSVPTGVTTGHTFTATITMNNSGNTIWTNTGAKPYRLGSVNPSNNVTWGTNRINLTSSPINPGQNATFTLTGTAPIAGGTYAFSWRMLREPTNWFGDAFTNYISVVIPGPGTNFGTYSLDSGNMNSTARNGSYVSFSTCSGLPAWYSFGIPESGSNCTVFNRDIRWMPTQPQYGVSGRGYLTASMIVPDAHATATANFIAVDSGGNDISGITGSVNECAYSCSTVTFYSGVVNLGSFGGFRSNTQDDGPPGSGGCNKACGTFPVGYSQMHIQAARWQYVNDWTCLGGYASSGISDTANRSFSEANLYLYPALDTSHGNVIGAAMGLSGKNPGRVTTGDCNNANTLDFKGNAAAYGGGDGMDSYGFAWVFSPVGATPQFVVGSDDGNRLWVNGVLKNDTNAVRSLTRDQDHTASVTLAAGWSRVLFKVHNASNSFQGTVSLRSGSNANLNEPSVNYYDLGGYFSYGLAYEQDDWYPQIVVSNLYGVSSPLNGAAVYGNNTTVTANGKSNGQGPVPFWRTMQYQWGYGLGNADSNFTDVSGTPTAASWSHTISGVTGHRRVHLFAVSRSGRTSFQNSGIAGGSVYQDAGNYARYYDVYVDNVAPESPTFSSATGMNTNQIGLAWDLPLDQGVNTAPSATESAGAAGNQDAQNWYVVADVGVQVYRNGSVISPWSAGVALSDGGLAANTPYSYTIEARDNNSGARGNWHNFTGQQATQAVWTLSVPPGSDSISPSQTNATTGNTVTWTAVGGFGVGKIQYYRYAWDQSPTHNFDDSETQWSGGTVGTVPTLGGTWYLHVKGYNGADVGNGTYDYAVTATQTQPQILSINAAGGVVSLTWSAVSGSIYRVQYSADLPPIYWSNLPPDVQATNSTASAVDGAGAISQRFYRVVLLP